ncbi:tetratricopeptide repeat protein [Metabacillus herbersteinensis]|uniref:Tetratricopeptide repeat protein n=1 Tax=Metabacillus herbersteinensis TaxID=283816 RepID=A0ABV6GLS4_9BACI
MGKQLSKTGKKAQVVPFLQDGQYYYKKGLKAYREHNFEKASKYMKRAIELDPTDSEKLSQLATIYTDMGHYQQSNELLSHILKEVDIHLNECHYFMANNFAHLGLFQEAYKCATAYAEKEPFGEFIADNEDLIELLTIEDEDDGNFLQDPDDLIIKQDAAKSLLENSQFEDAILLLQEIVKEYPEFWSAYNNLSLAYFYVGEVEKAKAYLQTVLQRSPGNLHALCNLLVFYYYERKDDKVEELATSLSNVHPILFEHRYKLGASFALVGRYPIAYKWLRYLYKQGFEGDDTFYYWLSYSAYHTGKVEFAKQVWNRVLQENPQKEGFEPWDESKHGQHHYINMTVEERLYAIFLAAQTNNKQQIEEYQTARVPQTHFEKEFLELSLMKQKGDLSKVSSQVKCAFNTAEILYESTEDDNFFLFAFRILVKASKEKASMKNHAGWAAALSYLWKNEQGQKVSQANIAKEYNISVSTVAKYISYVKDC